MPPKRASESLRKGGCAQQLRSVHGLDERAIDRAVAAVTEALAGRGQLTRAQLADELRERASRVPGSC